MSKSEKITLKQNIIKCRGLKILIAYENLDSSIIEASDETSSRDFKY